MKDDMRHFFRAIEGIGFVAILIGMGAMDSPSILVPFLTIIIGLALFATGNYFEDYFVWYEGRKKK